MSDEINMKTENKIYDKILKEPINKYENGKIYKIVSIGKNKTNDIYIGSTFLTLKERLKNHLNEYNRKDCNSYCTSYEILKIGEYRIELIENYPCDNDDELRLREAEYIIENLDICVNKQIPKNISDPVLRKNKYANGKIYKIISKNTNMIYIGSTIQTLAQRMTGHCKDYRYYINKTMHYTSSVDMLEQGDYEIVELEKYPCNNNDELLLKEQEYIDKFRDICVNRQNAVKDPNYQSKYNLRNKEIRKIKSKIYRDVHKEEISEKGKSFWIEKGTEIMAKKKGKKINDNNKAIDDFIKETNLIIEF